MHGVGSRLLARAALIANTRAVALELLQERTVEQPSRGNHARTRLAAERGDIGSPHWRDRA